MKRINQELKKGFYKNFTYFLLFEGFTNLGVSKYQVIISCNDTLQTWIFKSKGYKEQVEEKTKSFIDEYMKG